ncbi:MAG: DNA-processing protein DprA [Neisseriaceae bacterium]|nr:DNA-processing protein DprA [Neisseriaceae bacterium]
MLYRDDLFCYLTVALTPYVGPISFAMLMKRLGSINAILSATADELKPCLEQADKALPLLLNKTAEKSAECAMAWLEKGQNRSILTLLDADYPMSLAQGMRPPPVLFLHGNIQLLQQPKIAIVGSRKATPQAVQIAKQFGQALSEQGITVVSGFADGIDAAAHQGALLGKNSTIGVLGTGIDIVYPAKNQDLAVAMSQTGLLLSEFPLNTTPVAKNFPRRNRLIAALGVGTVVIEAAERSGSLITARLAGELGRDVMAVPGSIFNPQSAGCHKLIRDGAALVTSVADILAECEHALSAFRQPENQNKANQDLFRQPETVAITNTKQPEKINHKNPKEPSFRQPETLDNTEKNRILQAMGFDPIHPDTLAQHLQMHPANLYAILLDLELDGIIATTSNGFYQRLQ